MRYTDHLTKRAERATCRGLTALFTMSPASGDLGTRSPGPSEDKKL